MHKLSRRTCLVSLTTLLATPALSQSAGDPIDIARRIYAPYLRKPDGDGTAAIDAIRPFAAPELKRLIDSEKACTKRKREMCAIDSDVLTDSQDPYVTNLQFTGQDMTPDTMTVRVSFRMGQGPKAAAGRVDMLFQRFGGQWLITDLLLRQTRSSLKQILKTPN